MADEKKPSVEDNPSSTAAPPAGTKDGVDIAAAAAGVASGPNGGTASTEDVAEGEEDVEVGPKVSGKSKMDGALLAQRSSPYAKPQAKKETPTPMEDAVTQNKRVYVGNLSWSVTWQALKDHMRAAGEVLRADILTGYDGRSKGCGIVEYETVEEANSAVNTLNNTELEGRQIFVREDREEKKDHAAGGGGGKSYGGGGGGAKNVYVGNLSYEVQWQDLKDHMRQAGEVAYAEVMTMHDGRSKGCGIVEFVSVEGAAKAIRELNDSELKGRAIFVREDREQGGGGGGGPREGDGGYQGGWQHRGGHAHGHGGGGRGGGHHGNVSVYVGNLSYETSWQELKDHMRAAGNVDKADILKGDDGRSKGCGVVLYQKPQEASRAIRELQNSELNGRPIFVRADQQAGGGHHNRGHGHHNPGFMPGEPAEAGCQLYVGNLSWETGWRELKDHFNQCGDVDRAEVAEYPDGKRKGFGLIRYRTAGDAQNAISTLHGEELDGRALEVRLDNKA